METRANYALIGAFTLAVVAAGFMFVYWFSSPGKSSQLRTYQIIFTGSVSGLSRGSQVNFNGLRVGQVREIDLLQEDPSHVSAIIEINNRTPVKEDTRARLESQGLTGVASIALAGGSPTAPPIENPEDGSPPVIRADPSQFQNILESVERLSTKADTLLDKVNTLLDTNSAPLTGIVRNAQTFTQALADNSANVGSFLQGMGDLGRAASPLAAKLGTLSGDVDNLVKAVDPEKVRSVVGNVAQFTGTLAKNDDKIAGFMDDASALARRLSDTANKLDDVVASAGETIRAVDPAKISSAVDGVARIIGSIDQNRDNIDKVLKNAPQLTERLATAADNIGTVTGTLAKNSGKIDAFLSDAAALAAGLGETKLKVDGLLGDASNVVKGIDPAKVASTVDGLSRVVGSIDQNRDNIDKVLKDAPQLTARLSTAAD
ncbi:MAG: MCE family protein, partial [Methylobacteriaceae bacterium]|nr:MCE family protein [Methylobacteriaceae bacterium]